MTDKHVQSEAPHSNMEKDPSDWVTGDEAMTGAQMSYLKTLSEEAKVEFDESLTKAEASARIDELQQRTGRGAHHGGHSGQGEHGHVSASPQHSEDAAVQTSERKVLATADKGKTTRVEAGDSGAASEEGDLFDTEPGERETAKH